MPGMTVTISMSGPRSNHSSCNGILFAGRGRYAISHAFVVQGADEIGAAVFHTLPFPILGGTGLGVLTCGERHLSRYAMSDTRRAFDALGVATAVCRLDPFTLCVTSENVGIRATVGAWHAASSLD